MTNLPPTPCSSAWACWPTACSKASYTARWGRGPALPSANRTLAVVPDRRQARAPCRATVPQGGPRRRRTIHRHPPALLGGSTHDPRLTTISRPDAPLTPAGGAPACARAGQNLTAGDRHRPRQSYCLVHLSDVTIAHRPPPQLVASTGKPLGLILRWSPRRKLPVGLVPICGAIGK